MKKIMLAMMLGVATLGLTSCNDDNDATTDSRLTYYPELALKGDATVQVPVGTPYEEQGASAILQSEDVSRDVTISGTVDNNQIGVYTVTYSHTNVDGYTTSIDRTVVVYDPAITTDISGTYTVADGTNRYYQTDSITTAFSGYTVTITQAAPGVFYVSDLLGGYYDQRAGYGSSYAMTGYVQLLADNTIHLLSSSVAGWGDSATGWTTGTYDEANATIRYAVNYAGDLDFNIILTK